MRKIILPFAMISLILTSCSDGPAKIENYMKVISPAGAPAIAFYDQALNGKFETNTQPANVMAQLASNNYGMIVSDFYNGLKTIAKNDGDYKLAKILTGGNLYLVGIDKDTEPTAEDKIVSFGEGLIPDLAFKYIYGGDIASATSYVASVSEAAAVLQSGIYSGENIDYVVIAQPALFASMNNKEAATYGKLNVICSFKDKWEEKTGQKAIPQAGLFVNNTFYEEHRGYFEQEFALLDERIDTAINDPITIKETMNEQIPNLEDQQLFFGFNANVAFNVQNSKDTPNGFALVDPNEEVDIQSFFDTLGIKEDYSDYIL